jgi:hypothetical protein
VVGGQRKGKFELQRALQPGEESICQSKGRKVEELQVFFLFTDNTAAEGCFYRGTSKSKLLHSLVLSLRVLEVEYGMTLHIIHISGKRMIVQGTDGCSRGSLMEGVMAGEDMLTFFDLGQSALERHPPLLDWVHT